jgi:F420-dependent methylenetetrahydromethanopterin dehydrogenase
MSDKTNEEQLKVLQITELRRIADALDTVVKMVKEDQEDNKKRMLAAADEGLKEHEEKDSE